MHLIGYKNNVPDAHGVVVPCSASLIVSRVIVGNSLTDLKVVANFKIIDYV